MVREGGRRLQVYTTEDDRRDHRTLAEAVVEAARRAGLEGATIWRGIEGFGRDGRLRTARFPDASVGLPLIVEVVDRADKVDAFLPELRDLAPGCLVTTEAVAIRRAGAEADPDDPAGRSA